MIVLVAIVLVQQESVFVSPEVSVALLLSITLILLLGSTYKKDSVLSEVFHVGLLLAFCSLFVGQTIFLLLPIVFSLLILRTGNWKEWAVLLLGIGMCVILVMSVAIWAPFPLAEFKRVVQSAWSGSFNRVIPNAGHGVLIIALIAAIGGILRSLTNETVTERNLTLSQLSWLLSVILMVILLGMDWQEGLILAAFPLSVAITRTIERIKRWWLADLLLVSILAAPFLSNLWRL